MSAYIFLGELGFLQFIFGQMESETSDYTNESKWPKRFGFNFGLSNETKLILWHNLSETENIQKCVDA